MFVKPLKQVSPQPLSDEIEAGNHSIQKEQLETDKWPAVQYQEAGDQQRGIFTTMLASFSLHLTLSFVLDTSCHL